MKRTNQILFNIAATFTTLAAPGVFAGADENSPLGEHPALIARCVLAHAGYDYASKMYRHPAGLALFLEAPREMGEHPTVLVHRDWSKRRNDDVAKMSSHPALSRFAAVPAERPDPVLAARR